MEDQIEGKGQPHEKRVEGKLPKENVSVSLGGEFF
jgi:hypothetical protein